jgi:hypothetical protein
LERNEYERELDCSEDEPRAHGAAPIYLITVPSEFMDESEFEREALSGLEEAPIGTKFKLELSSATKFGLDDGPIGTTLGLELLDVAFAGCGC